tara:strand:+ start:854 stop:1135 length:282 start_codon:yes stop_codon:yes gene_type:complete
MKLAVVIDVDGDIMYVPEGKVFPNFPSPKVFNNIADAEEERDKWNTGIIVDLDDNNRTVPTIRSFDDEERRRAKEREEMNRDDGTSTGQDSTQ